MSLNKELRDRKILIYDIETSLNQVYTFYIGNKVSIQPNQIFKHSHILCICYKWAGEKEIYSLVCDLNSKKPEEKMLKEFMKVVKQATTIYGQNSNSFDNKWVRTSLMFNQIETFEVWFN